MKNINVILVALMILVSLAMIPKSSVTTEEIPKTVEIELKAETVSGSRISRIQSNGRIFFVLEDRSGNPVAFIME